MITLSVIVSVTAFASWCVGVYSLWFHGVWTNDRPRWVTLLQTVFLAVSVVTCLVLLAVIAL